MYLFLPPFFLTGLHRPGKGYPAFPSWYKEKVWIVLQETNVVPSPEFLVCINTSLCMRQTHNQPAKVTGGRAMLQSLQTAIFARATSLGASFLWREQKRALVKEATYLPTHALQNQRNTIEL